VSSLRGKVALGWELSLTRSTFACHGCGGSLGRSGCFKTVNSVRLLYDGRLNFYLRPSSEMKTAFLAKIEVDFPSEGE